MHPLLDVTAGPLSESPPIHAPAPGQQHFKNIEYVGLPEENVKCVKPQVPYRNYDVARQAG